MFPYEIDGNGEFEIDGIRFHIDVSFGHRRTTDAHAFTLVKNKPFLDIYADLAQQFPEPESIFEIGIYQGGSYVLFDKLFRPKRISALDLNATEVSRLVDYASGKPHRYLHFGVRQDNAEALSAIVRDDFSGRLDMVVDDASHLLGFTKRTFEVLFPQLSPGGLYIIEDWAWSHQAPYQGVDGVWADQPALTNILFELIAVFASTGAISKIEIHREFAAIHKSKTAPVEVPNFDSAGRFWDQAKLRGKRFSYI